MTRAHPANPQKGEQKLGSVIVCRVLWVVMCVKSLYGLTPFCHMIGNDILLACLPHVVFCLPHVVFCLLAVDVFTTPGCGVVGVLIFCVSSPL